jgi:hypothetical protein
MGTALSMMLLAVPCHSKNSKTSQLAIVQESTPKAPNTDQLTILCQGDRHSAIHDALGDAAPPTFTGQLFIIQREIQQHQQKHQEQINSPPCASTMGTALFMMLLAMLPQHNNKLQPSTEPAAELNRSHHLAPGLWVLRSP